MSANPNNTRAQKVAWKAAQSLGSRYMRVRESSARVPWGQQRGSTGRGRPAVRMLRRLAGLDWRKE